MEVLRQFLDFATELVVTDIFPGFESVEVVITFLGTCHFSDCKASAMWVPAYELELLRVYTCKVIADVHEATDNAFAREGKNHILK
ncbi:MAG: hypothetical protein IIV64_02795 [Muribaculaceae bacterium]|nr:hypothetical protein [Muribaculaceae bacterium]